MKGSENENRRSFLKKLAAGTVLVMAGVSSSRSASASATGEDRQAGSGNETLYNESDEFRDYYRSLRA